jgi:tRNA(Ile)-lysidine synthase
MPAERPLGRLTLARPFLGVPKARLIASLDARGTTWAEDPSNHDRRFRRVVARDALDHLAALGLDAARLAATAARMARAAAALDAIADRLIAEATGDGRAVALSAAALAGAPDEIRLRVLARLLRQVGVGDYPPRLERLERLDATLAAAAAAGLPLKRTLHGVIVQHREGVVRFTPEAGRSARGQVSAPKSAGGAGFAGREAAPGPGLPGVES